MMSNWTSTGTLLTRDLGGLVTIVGSLEMSFPEPTYSQGKLLCAQSLRSWASVLGVPCCLV
jgi:hypothetical protein